MNLFIPYPNTLETATILDIRRLNKQIIECRQMLKAINGNSHAWANHPCTLMYAPYATWLSWYGDTLVAFKQGALPPSEPLRPPFIGNDHLHNVHKARLYQKDNIHYAIFEPYNHYANYNIYIVDHHELHYINGKLLAKLPFDDSL